MRMNRKSSSCSRARDSVASRDRKFCAAFTLIELMASMAILGLIMVMLFSVFGQVNKAWLNGENRVETFTQARAVLDLMANELTQAVTSSNVWFYGDATNVCFVAPVGAGSVNNLADLCEVGYVFDSRSWKIARRFTAPTAPNINNGFWDIDISGSTWWNTWDTTTTAPLASNCVLNLSFVYFGQNLNQLTVPYVSTNLPYAIQINMNVIDARAASRLSVAGTSTNAIIMESMRPFSRTVYIPTHRS